MAGHKFELRNRKGAEDRISVGANMELLMDGKVLKGVTGVKIEVKAKNIAKITVDFIGRMDTHVIGSYSPAQIPKKKPKRI